MLRDHDLSRFGSLDGEEPLSLTTFDIGKEGLLTPIRLIVRDIITEDLWILPILDIIRIGVIGQEIDENWRIKWEIRLWCRTPIDDDQERDTWGDLTLVPADSTQGFAFGAQLARAMDQFHSEKRS